MKDISVKFDKNAITGGDAVVLRLEGVANADKYVGKEVEISFYEVDPKRKLDKLAEFTTSMKDVGGGSHKFAKCSRTDSFEYQLPAPETITETIKGPPPESWTIRYKPKYKPAHFHLTIDTDEGPEQHLIIINEAGDEAERCVFEIGVRIKMGRKTIFDGTKKPSHMTVDCVELLEDNCIAAAEAINMKHIELIAQRSMGIGYGVELPDFARAEPTKYTMPDRSTIRKYDLDAWGCLGYCYAAIKEGHTRSHLIKDWNVIHRRYKLNDVGNGFAKGLQEAGWDCVFFLPNENADYRKDYNQGMYKKVRDKGLYDYWGEQIKVASILKDSYVNSTQKLVKYLVDNIRFGFVQTWNHSALFVNGCIFECHWDREPTDVTLFEARYKRNGDETFETWRKEDCGIIMIPPGRWKP